MTADRPFELDEPVDGGDDELIAALAFYDESLDTGQSALSDATLAFDPTWDDRFARLRDVLDELARLREAETPRPAGESSAKASEAGHAATAPTDDDAPRRIGRFIILEELGRGGHGIVFRAQDPVLGRELALKVPRPELLLSKSARERFLREGRSTASLAHPNLVTVFEAGEAGPVCYLAQEYCPGPNLETWIRAQGQPIPPRQAAELVAQLAEGVEHAHHRGVVHRDLKPGNVLMQPTSEGAGANRQSEACTAKNLSDATQWTPRIVDFGLARLEEGSATLTATGALVGTPAYMAPEQLEAARGEVGPASDIYALGGILFQVLTGQTPFHGASQTELIKQILLDEPRRPRQVRCDVPADLEAICLRALEKRPADRYVTAGDMAADLRRFLRGEPTLARPLKTHERLVRWARRKPWAAALVATVAVALVALFSVLSWSNVKLSRAYREVVTHEQSARQSAQQVRQRAYVSDMRLLDEVWFESNATQMREILDAYNHGEPDIRGFEWWLYHRLFFEEYPSQVVARHAGAIQSIAASPVENCAAVAGADGVIRLYDAAGRLRNELIGHQGDVNCLAFSSDGRTLASAGNDHLVRVWDVATAALLSTLQGHSDWVSSVAFLGDDKSLASGGADRAIILWGLNDGSERGRLLGHTDTVRSLAYHRNTNTLFSAAEDCSLRAWDLVQLREWPDREPTGEDYPDPQRWIRQLAVERDQSSLCGVVFGNQWANWDLRKNPQILLHRCEALDSATRSLAVSGTPQGGMLAVGEEDGNILYLPLAVADSERRILRGHGASVDALAMSHDDRYLWSGSVDGELRQWSIEESRPVLRYVTKDALSDSFAIAPAGDRLAIVTKERELQIIDWASLEVIDRCPTKELTPDSVRFAPDGRRLAWATQRNELQMLEVGGTRWQLALAGDVQVGALSFDPSGNVVVAAGRGGVVLIDTVARREIGQLPHPEVVHTAIYRNANELVTSCQDGVLRVWNIKDRKVVREVRPGGAVLRDLCVSRDGRLVAVRGFRRLFVIELDSMKTVADLAQRGEYGGLAFLGDDRTLLAWFDNSEGWAWNVQTWQAIGNLKPLPRLVSFRASADGFRLVGADTKVLWVVDARPVPLPSQSAPDATRSSHPAQASSK